MVPLELNNQTKERIQLIKLDFLMEVVLQALLCY